MKTFKAFLSEGVYDPSIFKAIFLAGAPGSGKSYAVKKTTSGLGLKTINSDQLFEYLLKKNDVSMDMTTMDKETYTKSQEIRAVAKQSTKVKQKLMQGGRLGLVIDGTGKDYEKIEKQRAKMEEIGYDTLMIFVNVAVETSLARNQKRERKVRDDIVRANYAEVQGNMGKFQRLFGPNRMIIVDNDDGDHTTEFNLAWKQVKKFVEAPVQNRKAIEWIEAEKAKKKYGDI